MRYIKRPIEIEAFKWRKEIAPKWFDEAVKTGFIQHYLNYPIYGYEILIKRNDNEVNMAHAGDYIVKDQNGEIYPVKENVFFKTYKKVNE